MPVSAEEAAGFHRVAAADPCQSFGVNTRCYERAMRMTGVMLGAGARPEELGWATIWSPPSWLFEDNAPPVMQSPGVDVHAFRDLNGGRTEALFESYIFREVSSGSINEITVLDADGHDFFNPVFFGETPVEYRFSDLGGATWWDNHIAPTIRVWRGEGCERLVIDPELTDAPLTLDQWRSLQDPNGDTCVISIGWSGAATIELGHSSAEVLGALRQMAGVNERSQEAVSTEMIGLLTSGVISHGAIRNPYDSACITDDHGSPSAAATSEYFAALLDPLSAFKRWRAGRIASLHEAAAE